MPTAARPGDDKVRLLLQNKPPAALPILCQVGWGRKKQTPQKSVFLSQTCPITIFVTVSCQSHARVRNNLTPSQQILSFFMGEKKSESKANRFMLGACQLAHTLLMVCKHFSSKRVLRNAFCLVLWRHPGTPEAVRGSGWEEDLANLWSWTKGPWKSIHRLSCFSLLLAASTLSASLAEIFLSLSAKDSQICLG